MCVSGLRSGREGFIHEMSSFVAPRAVVKNDRVGEIELEAVRRNEEYQIVSKSDTSGCELRWSVVNFGV